MRFNVKFTALALIGALSLVGGASAYAAPDDTVTVQPGDTLSAISTANGSDYVRVFNANPNIANPDIINAGDQIRIPTADEQLPDRMGQIQAAQVAHAAPAQQPSAQSHAVSQQPQATQVSAANRAAIGAPIPVMATVVGCSSHPELGRRMVTAPHRQLGQAKKPKSQQQKKCLQPRVGAHGLAVQQKPDYAKLLSIYKERLGGALYLFCIDRPNEA